MAMFKTFDGDASFPKVRRHLFIHYEEASLIARRRASPAWTGTLPLTEFVSVISAKTLKLPVRARMHWPDSSTRGDSITGVKMPSADDDTETWLLPMKKKNEIFAGIRSIWLLFLWVFMIIMMMICSRMMNIIL